jgi:hypothetical protein
MNEHLYQAPHARCQGPIRRRRGSRDEQQVPEDVEKRTETTMNFLGVLFDAGGKVRHRIEIQSFEVVRGGILCFYCAH